MTETNHTKGAASGYIEVHNDEDKQTTWKMSWENEGG